MTITNKKLLKSYKDILSASINAKSLVNAEIEKVDAKYRALAEKEKTDLNKQLKTLDTQIDLYTSMLNDDAPVEEKVVEAVEEPIVVDTIFPENNEPDAVEEPEEDMPAEEPVEDKVVESDDNGFSFDNESEEEDEAKTQDDNDGFPEFPQEW